MGEEGRDRRGGVEGGEGRRYVCKGIVVATLHSSSLVHILYRKVSPYSGSSFFT